jgi:hypothetical protein
MRKGRTVIGSGVGCGFVNVTINQRRLGPWPALEALGLKLSRLSSRAGDTVGTTLQHTGHAATILCIIPPDFISQQQPGLERGTIH